MKSIPMEMVSGAIKRHEDYDPFQASELKLESLIPTEQLRNLKQKVIILEFKRYIPVRKAHAS